MMLQITFLVSLEISWSLWKALEEAGCIRVGLMAFGLVVQKFLNIE
jgi:hypothetical protein